MKSESNYMKSTTLYYHPFCLFTTSRAYYKNIVKVKNIDFELELIKAKRPSKSD
jgi:hypothetical protein